MKHIFTIIFIISILFFFGCSKKYRVNESREIEEPIKMPGFEKYISCFFMGEVGTMPTGCKISDVEMTEDSVLVCGKAFDMDTQKSFNIDVWVGSFVEKTNNNGKKDLIPSKKEFLSTTDNDGTFCLKFQIHKNDVLLMDQIGYDPAIFEVYQYLRDARLVE